MKTLAKLFAAILLISAILYNGFLLNCLSFYLRKDKPVPVTLSKDDSPRLGLLFMPLDSRPPCLDFVSQLGKMSGINIILPPKPFLDNYFQPADYYALRQWAINNSSSTDGAIISLDMFLYGGLIASRRSQTNQLDEESALKGLEFFEQRQKNLYAFSVIPRLLIAEDDATKLWQYHMMVYSTKKDMEDTFNNPADFARMQEMLDRVPPELIERFNKLYQKNDAFNHQLALTAKKNVFRQLVVGQDDGQPFGRPNANMHKMAAYRQELGLEDSMSLTQGADEIAMLQLARYANISRDYQPKIKVVYAHDSVPDLVMHFMPITVAETVREKVGIIGGLFTNSPQEADFILFVHCGGGELGMSDLPKVADRIISLTREKPVALVDLSVNFFRRETVLRSLIEKKFPLSSLIAYAGWNTSSNSIGTALSQGSLFLNSKRRLDKQYWPKLYQENFEFTISRVLDDWAYQKDAQDSVDQYLRWKGIDPYRLGAEKSYAEGKIRQRMFWLAKDLFYANLGRYPFYADDSGAYYITKLQTDITLPWERTFEIRLLLQTEVGKITYQ